MFQNNIGIRLYVCKQSQNALLKIWPSSLNTEPFYEHQE